MINSALAVTPGQPCDTNILVSTGRCWPKAACRLH